MKKVSLLEPKNTDGNTSDSAGIGARERAKRDAASPSPKLELRKKQKPKGGR